MEKMIASLFLMFVPLINVDASENPKCALIDEKLVPVLKHGSSKVVNSSEPKLGEDHVLQESIKLKNGLFVEYSVGGCEELFFSFSFEGFILPDKSGDKKTMLAFSRRLLKRVPLKEKKQRKMLLSALKMSGKVKEGYIRGGKLALPCGTADCSMVLSEDKKDLTLKYRFPVQY